MAKELAEYLKEQAAIPFQYVDNDCAAFCLKRLDMRSGKNGFSAWLGRYSDKFSCMRFISDNGGMSAIADQFLKEFYGCQQARERVRENIVLSTVRGIKLFGIRVTEESVAFKLARGLHICQNLKIEKEWSCPF